MGIVCEAYQNINVAVSTDVFTQCGPEKWKFHDPPPMIRLLDVLSWSYDSLIIQSTLASDLEYSRFVED